MMPGRPSPAQLSRRQCGLLDYAAADIPKLSQLLAVATPEQFGGALPERGGGPAPATIEDFARIAATPPSVELGSRRWHTLVGALCERRRSPCCGWASREKVLPVFEMSDDLRGAHAIHLPLPPAWSRRGCAVGLSGAGQRRLRKHPLCPKHSVRPAAVVGGVFSRGGSWNASGRALLEQLAGWYRHDPSSGVHGATGWLLRKWGQAEAVRLGGSDRGAVWA